jgi:hypothetical protein
MSLSEVKAKEKEGILSEETATSLLYSGITINGLDAVLGYLFNKAGQLYAAGYVITQKHSNPTTYILDFNDLKEVLNSQYGAPVKDDVVWLDDLYKGNPFDWGKAVIAGDLIYSCGWETPSIYVWLTLNGSNDEPNFTLLYLSKSVSSDTGKTSTEGL